MGYALRKQEVEYNAISADELSRYMTLDEMHDRLTTMIHNHFAQKA